LADQDKIEKLMSADIDSFKSNLNTQFSLDAIDTIEHDQDYGNHTENTVYLNTSFIRVTSPTKPKRKYSVALSAIGVIHSSRPDSMRFFNSNVQTSEPSMLNVTFLCTPLIVKV
jgi:hypothetical protein